MSKNFSSDFEQKEFKEILARYEEMIAGGQSVYLDADQFVDITEYYASLDDYTKSMDVMAYALKVHPKATELLTLKAHLLIEQGKLEEAQKIAYAIPESYEYEVKLLKALLFIKNNKIDNAESLLQEINNEKEPDADNYLDAAYIYMDDNYPEYALPWFEKAFALSLNDSEALIDFAECCYRAKEVGKAVSLYNKLLDENPYSTDSWFGLGKIYYSQSEFDKALEAYDFVLTINQEHRGAQLMKAHCFFKLENYKEAAKYYLLCVQTDTNPEMSYFFAGLCYLNEKDYKKAIESFSNSLEKEPDLSENNVEAYTYMAVCYDGLNDFENADKNMDKAIKAQTDADPELWVNKGRIQLHAKKQNEALISFDQALRIDDYGEAQTYMDIAVSYYSNELLSEALDILEQLEGFSPGYDLSYMYTAYIHLLKNDKEKFKLYFNKALKSNPGSITDFADLMSESEAEIKQKLLLLKESLGSVDI